MSIRPGAPQAPAPAQGQQRRATSAERGAWVRQMFGLSRKPAPVQARPERSSGTAELRDELRARLLELDHEYAAKTLRHLVVVQHQLGVRGWTGVEALPVRVLRKARIQAEMLGSREPSPLLTEFVERLERAELAAAVREDEKAEALPVSHPRGGPDELQPVEVSDTSFEEYELTEQSWVGTVPGALGKPERETWPEAQVADDDSGLHVEECLEAAAVIEGFGQPVRDQRVESLHPGQRGGPLVSGQRVEASVHDDWVDFDRD